MALFTPTNQKRLTNVAVVRMKKAGKRFEIACYPNKVKPWRDHIETDIDEVLQMASVFTNVSKGQMAKRDELMKAFNSDDQLEICKQILAKGELQVTEKERTAEKESLYKDVAQIVSDKCINPDTKNCYTVSMIEKMMKDCHVTMKPGKPAKQQALDVIRQLKKNEQVKLERATMTVLLSVDKKFSKKLKESVRVLTEKVIREDFGAEFEMEVVVEPGKYRELDDLLKKETKGKYSLDILELCSEKEKDPEPPAPDAPPGASNPPPSASGGGDEDEESD